MYFYSVFVFFYCFLNVYCIDRYFDVANFCEQNNKGHIFVVNNSMYYMHFILPEKGLNCSIEFVSESPKLNFDVVTLNLPHHETTELCWQSLIISDFANHYLGVPGKSTDEICTLTDLPLSRTIVTTSPAVLTVYNRCLPEKCNYNASEYNFEIRINTNYVEGPIMSHQWDRDFISTTFKPEEHAMSKPEEESVFRRIMYVLGTQVIAVGTLALVFYLHDLWNKISSLCRRVRPIVPVAPLVAFDQGVPMRENVIAEENH